MRSFFLFLCLSVSFLSAQEYPYQIEGTLEGVPDSTMLSVMLYTPGVGASIDTVWVENGEIRLEGVLKDAYPQRLGLRNFQDEGPIGGLEFWIESAETPISISGEGKYMALWEATSEGKEQKALNAFLAPTRELQATLDSLSNIRKGFIQAIMSGEEDQDYRALLTALDAEYDSIRKPMVPLQFEQIKANPNSFTAVRELYYISSYYVDQVGGLENIEPIYSQMEPPYSETLFAEGISSNLWETVAPGVGDDMVNVVAKDLEGNLHQLKDLHEPGQYMLLDFWSLGCYPCILAAPELRALQAEYPNALKIVGFNVDTKFEWWQDATERDSITWTNLSDLKGTFAGAAVAYGVEGLPTYVLIDPEGEIVLKFSGFGEGIFEEKVEPYLEEE